MVKFHCIQLIRDMCFFGFFCPFNLLHSCGNRFTFDRYNGIFLREWKATSPASKSLLGAHFDHKTLPLLFICHYALCLDQLIVAYCLVATQAPTEMNALCILCWSPKIDSIWYGQWQWGVSFLLIKIRNQWSKKWT